MSKIKKNKKKSLIMVEAGRKAYITRLANNAKKEKEQWNRLPNGKKRFSKEMARNKKVQIFSLSPVNRGNVLTLSAGECKEEIKIHTEAKNKKDLMFSSCELNPKVFKTLKRNIVKNHLKFMLPPSPIDIKEAIMNSAKDKWAHLNLDYCDALENHREEIKYAIKNKIMKNLGLMTLTLSQREKDKSGSGKSVEEQLEDLVMIVGGYDYKTHFCKGYGNGMVLMIIQRVDQIKRKRKNR